MNTQEENTPETVRRIGGPSGAIDDADKMTEQTQEVRVSRDAVTSSAEGLEGEHAAQGATKRRNAPKLSTESQGFGPGQNFAFFFRRLRLLFDPFLFKRDFNRAAEPPSKPSSFSYEGTFSDAKHAKLLIW